MLQAGKSLVALLCAIVGVHILYIGYIRPEAARILAEAQQLGDAAPREFAIILKDVEQQICITLMAWGVYLILAQCFSILRQRYLFETHVDPARDSFDKAFLTGWLQNFQEKPASIRDAPQMQVLQAGIYRFLTTGSVQDASDAISDGVEDLAVKQEADNSMIRYLIWAIPSIGFIGTVRGIGQALAQADEALAGDIAAMTDSLGVAFNSTLVALLLSVALMFLLYQLQRLQDDVLVKTKDYCNREFLLKVSRSRAT